MKLDKTWIPAIVVLSVLVIAVAIKYLSAYNKFGNEFYANCTMLKDAIYPAFDYCHSKMVLSNEYDYECTCCWDRRDVVGFSFCRRYAVKVVDENLTEVWEIK